MASYVVIDFETANERRDSACAIGVVRVDDGVVSQRWMSVINPNQPFAGMNIGIHGIRPADVADAPSFPEVLERLLRTYEGTEVLVAHSAAFDAQVLAASASRYQVDFGDLPFACTRVFARHWFPGWPSYSLAHISERLSIAARLGSDQHHEALWDASACQLIADAGLSQGGHDTWAAAAGSAALSLGVVSATRYRGCVAA